MKSIVTCDAGLIGSVTTPQFESAIGFIIRMETLAHPSPFISLKVQLKELIKKDEADNNLCSIINCGLWLQFA